MQNQLVLHYQPKISLLDGSVIGAEALLRWLHPERGLLQPGSFVPHLQGASIESRLGEWVLAKALEQHMAWLAAGIVLPVPIRLGPV